MTMEQMSNIIEENRSFLMHFAMERTNYNKQDAEELFQDTSIKLILNPNSYDSNKGKFTSYAARVMRNLAIDRYRLLSKKAHNPTYAIRIDNFQLHNQEVLDLDHILGETINLGEYTLDEEFIMDLISRLPKKSKIALIWRMDGYDYKTIAEILQIPVSNLRPRVNRARKILKDAIEKEKDLSKLVT